jgi:hypothetical protein
MAPGRAPGRLSISRVELGHGALQGLRRICGMWLRKCPAGPGTDGVAWPRNGPGKGLEGPRQGRGGQVATGEGYGVRDASEGGGWC